MHNEKKCTSDFKKGLLLGSILGGVLVGFGMSKKGKELREKAMEYSQELFVEVRKKVVEWGEMSRDAYEDMIRRAAEEFTRRKGLALEMKEMLVERLRTKWDDLQSDMLFRKVRSRFNEGLDKTREGFERAVHEIVDEYEKRKDLSGFMKYRLVRDLKRKWEEVKGESEESSEGWR